MQTLVKMARNPEIFGENYVPKVLVITPAPVRKEIHTSDFYGMYDEESVRKSELLDQEYHRALKDMKEVYFLNAGEIAEKLQITPAALSYHLKLLKNADLISEYKEKNFVYYEINTTVFDELIIWVNQFGGKKV